MFPVGNRLLEPLRESSIRGFPPRCVSTRSMVRIAGNELPGARPEGRRCSGAISGRPRSRKGWGIS